MKNSTSLKKRLRGRNSFSFWSIVTLKMSRHSKVILQSGGKGWYERWPPLGCLQDVLSGRGQYDLGIHVNPNVAACWNHRKRQHRTQILNRVEIEIEKYKTDDISMWKNEKGKYKKVFSTRETWLTIREKHPLCDWHQAVWFKYATLRYSFILWTAIHRRLSTGERVRSSNQNVDVSCGFYQEPLETRKNLFFEWENIPGSYQMLQSGTSLASS